MDGAQYELLSLFSDGGLMMYPLVLCSLLALGVIIAKAYTLYVAHRDTKQVLASVSESARAGRMEDAIQTAAETRGPAAAILHAGLMRMRDLTVRKGELEQAITTTGTIELGFLERGLVVLATIANVAPLMGFLGTVAGMILAFASIETAGQVDPILVAGGIKVALLTTAAGLTIAIPVNIFYNYFVARIDKLIVDMEQGAQEVLNLAWDLERDGKLQVVGRRVPVRQSLSAAGASTRPTSIDSGMGGVTTTADTVTPVEAAASGAAAAVGADLAFGGASHAVEEIQGIGKALGKRLRALGIETTHGLLQHCRTSSGRSTVREQVDVEQSQVENWTTQADLMRIGGMSGDAAEIIAAAGLSTLPKFCQAEAASLAAQLPAINAERSLVPTDALPDEAAIQAWQRDGRRLDPVVEDL